MDQRELHPGPDWDEQIVEVLRTCRGLLFVRSRDSVSPDSVCKQEWVRALKYKKPVIPLRLHADAELPFRLGSRQFIDFSGDFNAGLARLQDHLAWTSTPAGVLQELRTRLSDAQRELPRTDPKRQPLIEREIEELKRRIAAQQHLVDHPDAARQQTSRRIETELERIPPTQATRGPTAPDPDRQPATDGRSAVLPGPGTRDRPARGLPAHSRTAHDHGGGRGGVGKTALVCRLLKALEPAYYRTTSASWAWTGSSTSARWARIW